jgi:TrmH family RNA methyltransferase
LSGVINSTKNERIRRYRRLRKKNFRYKERRFLVEGLRAVKEALYSPREIECIICDQRGSEGLEAYADLIRHRDIPCYSVTDEVMTALSTTVTPQGVTAICHMLHMDLAELLDLRPSFLLVANRVRDPGNLGNMVRVADAAGTEGMIICKESVDVYNPKTVRSTAGSIFHLPISIDMDLNEAVHELHESGYTVYAADAHQGTNMWEMEWPDRMALVMGNEAWGMPEEEEALADARVRVPLFGKAESLNVSAASAVLLYEVGKHRGLKE